MRSILGRLRIPVWCEIMSGLSWRAYAAIDVYRTWHSPGMDVRRTPIPSHHVVYTDMDVRRRKMRPQCDRNCCPVWVSMGQVSDIDAVGMQHGVHLGVTGILELLRHYNVTSFEDVYTIVDERHAGRALMIMRQVYPGVPELMMSIEDGRNRAIHRNRMRALGDQQPQNGMPGGKGQGPGVQAKGGKATSMVFAMVGKGNGMLARI